MNQFYEGNEGMNQQVNAMENTNEEIGRCPLCGAAVKEKEKGFFCTNRSCHFVFWKNNHFMHAISKEMTREVASALLNDGKCELKDCKSLKSGKRFSTTLTFSVEGNGQPTYKMNFPERKRQGAMAHA